SVGGGCRRRLTEYLANRLSYLVNLSERGEEVHGAGLLAVVHLLAVEIHFESAAVRRRERDSSFAVVDRGELGRHTDGHGEIPSDDAVDDLDVTLALGHVIPPWRFGADHVIDNLSVMQSHRSGNRALWETRG